LVCRRRLVRNQQRAPIAPVAQPQRQHAQTVPSASSNLARRTIFHALSSEAERRSHAPKVEISKFSARTSSASLAQWQSAAPTWPRSQDRSLQDAPVPRTRSSHTLRGESGCELRVQKRHWHRRVAGVPSIPKFAQRSPQMLANFGIGTLN
jgi:hypothetical protein